MTLEGLIEEMMEFASEILKNARNDINFEHFVTGTAFGNIKIKYNPHMDRYTLLQRLPTGSYKQFAMGGFDLMQELIAHRVIKIEGL